MRNARGLIIVVALSGCAFERGGQEGAGLEREEQPIEICPSLIEEECPSCGDGICTPPEDGSWCSDCGPVPPPIVCYDMTPNMTSATTPYGVVTRSGVHESDPFFEAWHAFDSSISSMWISAIGQTPAWIAYDFQVPRTINKYSITYTNGQITTRAPKSWQLQAWTGSSWVTKDSRSNQTNWSGFQTRVFNVSQPGTYMKYRLHVTDDNDSRSGIVVISMGNLTLDVCSPGGCSTGMLCSSEAACDQICTPGGGQCSSGCCACY